MHRFTDSPVVSFLLGNYCFLTGFIMLIMIGGFIDDTQILLEADNNLLQRGINILGKSVPRFFDKPAVISLIVCFLFITQ